MQWQYINAADSARKRGDNLSPRLAIATTGSWGHHG